MTTDDLAKLFVLPRKRTLDQLDAIEKLPDPAHALGWRPGPGRAHAAWQLMHLAATDDRHLNARLTAGQLAEPEYVRRFAGGSVPDDDIPPIAEIRRYLDERRTALLSHLRSLSGTDLSTRPTPDAQWCYEDWFLLLSWHEAHHHGQLHITLNLYRAANEAKVPPKPAS